MRYYLFNLLSKDIAEYNRLLVNRVANEFGLTFTKDQNIPTHFTLKYRFETEDISPVEKLLEEFAKNHVKKPIRVGGFDGFPPDTVFMNIRESEDARSLFSELITSLKTLDWMPWDQFDGYNLRFHTTIAEKCGEKYSDVLRLLEKEEKHFDTYFDNVSILKVIAVEDGPGKWVLHKTYSLQD